MSAAWRSRLTWIVAGVFIAGMALLAWNQIARDLAEPVQFDLSINDAHLGLARPQGGISTVSSYAVTGVSVELRHISTQLQWMLAGDTLLKCILTTTVVLVVGVVWVRTTAGRPFARSMTVSLASLAVLIAVLGTGIELLESFIGLREAYEVLGNQQSGTYFHEGGISVSGLAIFIALGIGLLASAFAIGARLTRDTEGLV
jgi:hypothetical protein